MNDFEEQLIISQNAVRKYADEVRELESELKDLKENCPIPKGGIMTRMPWIAKLAEEGNLKELTEELGSSRMAEGFIAAAKEIRLQKNNPAFEKLNEIHDEMAEHRNEEYRNKKS